MSTMALRQMSISGSSPIDLTTQIASSPGTLIAPSAVTMSGDVLAYQPNYRARRGTVPPPTMLADFMALGAGTNDAAFVRFARRYGVLGICPKHGLPIGHEVLGEEVAQRAENLRSRDPHCFGAWLQDDTWAWLRKGSKDEWTVFDRFTFKDQADPTGAGWEAYERFEALEHWRAWIHRTRSLFQILAQLKKGQSASPMDWHYMLGAKASPVAAQGRTSWSDAFTILNWWLRETRTTPLIHKTGERNEISLGGNPHFALGQIALQLLRFVAGPRNAYVCDGCGAYYLRRKREPKADQMQFCPECGRKASNKLSAAKARAKARGRAKKEAR